MVATFRYAGMVPHVVAVLAYLAGLVVAIILLVRTKARAATLALVGFALLMLITLGQIVLSLPQLAAEFVRVQWLVWVLSCCCSVLDLAAIGCLIVAIWQAVTGTGKTDAAEDITLSGEIVEDWEEEPLVDVSDAEADVSPFATTKLSDVDDEESEGGE
jgi:hypothetical protein